MNLTGGELAGVITASVAGVVSVGKGVQWFFSSRVSREKWVDERVRTVFDDIRHEAARARAERETMQIQVDKLEGHIARLESQNQTLSSAITLLIPEIDAESTTVKMVHRMLVLAFAPARGDLPETMKDLLDEIERRTSVVDIKRTANVATG
jgi:chromosome segregation ATPase